MTNSIQKDLFMSRVAEEELPKTGDARKFLLSLVYELEGTNRTERRTLEWRYSGTQEAIDQKNGVDGYRGRHEREVESFRQGIERELNERGERLYAKEGSKILVRGPVSKG